MMKIPDQELFDEEFFEALEKKIPRQEIIAMKEETEELS